MRKTLFNPKAFIATLMLSGAIIASCGDDEKSFSAVDNQNPTISLENETIHWEFAKEFFIKAKINDADGIKTINLKNADLYLDKTIDILDLKGSDCTSYELNYKFTAPDSLKAETFPILITVEDLVGNVSNATFTASMDGDFTNPKFTVEPSSTINVIMSAFNFKFSVSDNKVIKRVTVKFPELNIDEDITNDTKEFNYKKAIELGEENRDYKGVIAAYDAFDNKIEKEITISKGELQDYEKMYLCDVEKESELSSDIWGVPMLITHKDAFTYYGEYYNQKKGTKIRFIPENQKTSFGPICFGIDPDNKTSFISDPDASEPIILDEISYYKFEFNTKTGQYSYSTIPMSEISCPDIDGIMDVLKAGTWNPGDGKGDQPCVYVLAGNTFEGFASWSPRASESPIMKQDESNPYLFFSEGMIKEGNEVEFTIVRSSEGGYWKDPSWRDSGKGDSDHEWMNMGGEGTNNKAKCLKTGTYRIEFDAYLLRSRITLVK